MVAVPVAPSGRLSIALAPPAESASAMITPPWRMPLAVHSDGAQSSERTTRSGVYSSVRIPNVAASGMMFSIIKPSMEVSGTQAAFQSEREQ